MIVSFKFRYNAVLSLLVIFVFTNALPTTTKPAVDGPFPVIQITTVNSTSNTGIKNAESLLGLGYNIYRGNPDGDQWLQGGDDPGVLMTKNILHIDQGQEAAPQVAISQRQGCQLSHQYNIVYNPKSYHDRLSKFVNVSGANDVVNGHAFALSSGYQTLEQQTESQHYVFQDYTTICSLGTARYKMALAGLYNFPLSTEFAVAACALPDQYSDSSYMKFLDDWGTHIVTEVDFGQRLTNRYRVKRNDYISFVVQNATEVVSQGGPLGGYQSSVMIDMNAFSYRQEFRHVVGSLHNTINIGGANVYDDIKTVLSPITVALDDKFYFSFESLESGGESCGNKTKLKMIQNNINTAIQAYPSYNSVPVPNDEPLAVPVTWPRGTYSLEKPLSGCPDNNSWAEGDRYEQTDKQDPDNVWSTVNHFDARLRSDEYTLRFCTKVVNQTTVYDIDWQKGDYCFYKYGTCPKGFQQGSLLIDDDNYSNHNNKHGTIPDGIFGHDSFYDFCCRSDGPYSSPIMMPFDKPFYLLKHKYGCQKVHGMMVTEEFLEWDTEDTNPVIHGTKVHPAGIYNHAVTRLIYCYYEPVADVITGPIIG